jgi:hypothetical protein
MGLSRPKGSPRTPGSGRKKGTPNKATVQRRLLFDEGRRANGTPLAREVLEQNMLLYVRLASEYAPPDKGRWQREKRRQFFVYSDKANLLAKWLCPYQSPQFRSITVQPLHEPGRPRGTPTIDALESFMITLAKTRRHLNPPTIDAVPVPDETPAEAAKVIDGKNGGHNNGR